MIDIPLVDGRIQLTRVGRLIKLQPLFKGAYQVAVTLSPDNSAALRLVLEQMELAIAPGKEG